MYGCILKYCSFLLFRSLFLVLYKHIINLSNRGVCFCVKVTWCLHTWVVGLVLNKGLVKKGLVQCHHYTYMSLMCGKSMHVSPFELCTTFEVQAVFCTFNHCITPFSVCRLPQNSSWVLQVSTGVNLCMCMYIHTYVRTYIQLHTCV